MTRAIDMARSHRTHPNPRVGCVIADSQGEIVGEGVHRGVGTDHAEREALGQAGGSARGGTAVVSLEPCSHHGRTPPCVQALLDAGIAKVVVATADPDRRVRGRGLEILKEAGVDTSVGLLAEAAIDLDPAYHHHRRTGRPYVRAILDGRLQFADPAVRADLEALEEDIDLMLSPADLGLVEHDQGSLWRRLVSLGERGSLHLGVRDEGLIGLLRRTGLVDGVTVYSPHPSVGSETEWNSRVYRMASRTVGSCFRIDLCMHLRGSAGLVRREAEAAIPTPHGTFRAIGYESVTDGRQHIALVKGEVEGSVEVLVRIHSECLTGDVFGSLRCDCGSQLDEALRRIGLEGRGVVVYIRGHEGRGIGLLQKLAAYALQETGRDTVEANLDLGLPEDGRDYRVGAEILADLGISSLRLLTNNPAKSIGIEENGVRILERIPLVAGENDYNRSYLRTKVAKLGHVMDLDDRASQA